MSETYDICAAVVSDLAFDARVWKEARSLASAGYRVRLIGCRYEVTGTRHRREQGIDVVEIPLGTRAGRVSLFGRGLTLVRLWRTVLVTPARAYHAHNVHVAPAAWTASRLRGAGLVYDAHELYGESSGQGVLDRVSGRLARSVERFVVRRSNAVITTNRSRADQLRKRYGRDHVSVLANVPVRVEQVIPLDPGYPAGAPIVLYQGGVYARSRAFREVIAAVALLDVHLAIIGFGRDQDLKLIRGWAAEHGVTPKVHLLPPRPFDELVRTAAAASVGLVPVRADNLSNFLGDTNKLFEYLMAGLPVAASDLPEIRVVATQGNPPVGELFDPDSPASIADAITRLLADPAEYELRCREARRLALERFNWNLEERRLLDLYETILPPPAESEAPA
jgi:glycosyltransferase involved in cell wall biosynthesis